MDRRNLYLYIYTLYYLAFLQLLATTTTTATNELYFCFGLEISLLPLKFNQIR